MGGGKYGMLECGCFYVTHWDQAKCLFEKYICRVRSAHQPLKAPEGIKRVNSECDRDPKAIVDPDRDSTGGKLC